MHDRRRDALILKQHSEVLTAIWHFVDWEEAGEVDGRVFHAHSHRRPVAADFLSVHSTTSALLGLHFHPETAMQANASFDASRKRPYAKGLLPLDDLRMRAGLLSLSFTASR
jgi:hypothetical protein